MIPYVVLPNTTDDCVHAYVNYMFIF